MSLTRFHRCSLLAAAGLLIAACGSGNSPVANPPQTKPVNDTGVTACFSPEQTTGDCPATSAPGQDAEFGRDARTADLSKIGSGAAGFDFTKIASDGSTLPNQDLSWDNLGSESAGSQWSCVTDHVTGLTWEVKRNDASSPRHFNHTYSWYDPDATRNSGVPGIRDGGSCEPAGSCDTQAYLESLNRAHLCGRDNWRLPDVNELVSIIDQSRVAPPLDPSFFPNTSLNAYWTRQTVAQVPDKAWYVYFTGGSSGNIDKTSRAFIRAVSPKP